MLSNRIVQKPKVLQALFLLGCRNGHNVGFRSAFLCDLSGFEQAGNKQAPGPKGVTAEWPLKRDSLAIKQLADGYVML